MKRVALLVLAIPALLWLLGSPARADPSPVTMRMLNSYVCHPYLCVTGQLTDAKSGAALGGRRVCLDYATTDGAVGTSGCWPTGRDGSIAVRIPATATEAVVAFAWEC